MDSDHAKRLITASFPELTIETVKKIGEGWDNFAFEADDDLIFRFPKHQEGVENLLSEARFLPRVGTELSGKTAIQIPRPDYVAQPSAIFGFPFLGYRKLQGRTACIFGLRDDDRNALAEDFAHFLKGLHLISIELAAAWGVEEGETDRTEPKMLLGRIEESAKTIHGSGIHSIDWSPLLGFARSFPLSLDRSKRRLIHGRSLCAAFVGQRP